MYPALLQNFSISGRREKHIEPRPQSIHSVYYTLFGAGTAAIRIFHQFSPMTIGPREFFYKLPILILIILRFGFGTKLMDTIQ